MNNEFANAEALLPELRRLRLGRLMELAVYNKSPGLSCELETSVVGTVWGIVARVCPPTDAGIELVLRNCIGSNTLMNSFLAAEVGPSGQFFRVHLCREGEEGCSMLPGKWVDDPANVEWRHVLGEGTLHSHCWRLREDREIDEPWSDGCFTTVTVDLEQGQGQEVRYLRTRYPQKTVREETVSGVLARGKLKAKAASSSGRPSGPDVEILGVARGARAGEPRFIPAPVLPGRRVDKSRGGIMGRFDALGSSLVPASTLGGNPTRSLEPPAGKPRAWRPSSFLAPKMKARQLRESDPKLLMPAALPPPLSDLRLAPADGAAASDLQPRISKAARNAELARLAEFAKGNVAREKEARGNPSKLLALRAAEGSNKSSLSSDNASEEDVLAQVCAALGVDSSGSRW